MKEIADKCSFQKLKNVEKCYPKSMEDRLHDISKKTGQYPTLPSIYRKGMRSFFGILKESKKLNWFYCLFINDVCNRSKQ